MRNHYDWLEKHLSRFFEKCGVNWNCNAGIICSHGDKCYAYQDYWEKNGIPFEHGVAIYLLTHCSPYCNEVRETKNGWVDVSTWIVKNYSRFENDLEYVSGFEYEFWCCEQKMNTTAFIDCNGWICRICGKEKYDIASMKI